MLVLGIVVTPRTGKTFVLTTSFETRIRSSETSTHVKSYGLGCSSMIWRMIESALEGCSDGSFASYRASAIPACSSGILLKSSCLGSLALVPIPIEVWPINSQAFRLS